MKRHSVILFLPLLLWSCSSGVTVRASRLAGIVVDKGIAVEVGRITGKASDEFRGELLAAILSQKQFGTPGDSLTYGSILVEGRYDPDYREEEYIEESGDEKKQMIRKTYTASFEYTITNARTGEHIVDGMLQRSHVDTDEKESTFLGAIGSAILDAIISSDPYSPLRENVIERFVAEIGPHQVTIDVVLFDDSDIPELEEGIQFAKRGAWKDALRIFLDAADKYPDRENLHKALYDAGVAYEYTHQYAYAKEFITRALRMSYVKAYATELSRCERYEDEWRWREGYLEKLKMMESNDE